MSAVIRTSNEVVRYHRVFDTRAMRRGELRLRRSALESMLKRDNLVPKYRESRSLKDESMDFVIFGDSLPLEMTPRFLSIYRVTDKLESEIATFVSVVSSLGAHSALQQEVVCFLEAAGFYHNFRGMGERLLPHHTFVSMWVDVMHPEKMGNACFLHRHHH